MSLHDGLQDGDEEVEELLPIFDPELPSKVRERLSRAPERLVPAEKKPTRVKPQNADPLSSATKVVMAVCLLALTALVTALVAWLAAALMPLLVGLSALLLLVGIVAGFVAGGVWGGLAALVLAGVIIAVGQWLGRDGVVVLLSVLTALFGILVTIRAVFGDAHDSRPRPTTTATCSPPTSTHTDVTCCCVCSGPGICWRRPPRSWGMLSTASRR